MFIFTELNFNSFNPKIKIKILLCRPYSFTIEVDSGEKLTKYQANTSCVIMSLILLTTLFYEALLLQGEIWCWSLWGFKGLNKMEGKV